MAIVCSAAYIRRGPRHNAIVAVLTVAGLLLGTLAAIAAEGSTAGGEGGQELFASQCAGCHGPRGQGDGPASTFLYPRPRNFLEQPFKLGGAQEDVTRAIRRGIPGTSMPAFVAVLDNAEINALASYVRSLAGRNAVALSIGPVKMPDPVGSAERGRKIYVKSCASCHGPKGQGDGPSARFLTDDAGVPIRPPNYARAAFKGGSDPASLFKRISAGMPGTPMPGYGDVYPARDRWDLVAFLRSIIERETPPPPGRLEVKRVSQLPLQAGAPGWSAAMAVSLPLNPLWQRPSWPPALTVRALHDGRRIAFRLSWQDATEDRTIGRVADFTDAVAVMVPARAGRVPFIGMGQGDQVGRILHWRAVGKRSGPDFAYPLLIRDPSPWQDKDFAEPASAVGNPLAASSPAAASGIMELVVAGPGTVTPVTPKHMHSLGKGRWHAGSWSVQITREIDVPRSDVRLSPGTQTHAAFAVWDGSAGDRNGQKSISQWIVMEVEK